MVDIPEKPVEWLGSTKADVTAMPDLVKREVGQALYFAQGGQKHRSAKPLTGFKGAKVLEIVSNYNTDTYRCVYTVVFPEAVYVLHAFQKKSKSGIATPQSDLDLIASRLKGARQHYQKHYPSP